MTRPDVLLLLIPITLTLLLYGRRIHRYGWQTELCEEQPRHGRSTGRPTAAAPSVSASTSEEPGACSSQSSGYYAAVDLAEPALDEATFDAWKQQAARR